MTDTLMDLIPRIDGGPAVIATFYGLLLLFVGVGVLLALSAWFDLDRFADVALAVDDCRELEVDQ